MNILTPEEIKTAKTLRAIYKNSRFKDLAEERRIWQEQIAPHCNDLKEPPSDEGVTSKFIDMDDEIFDFIVEKMQELNEQQCK